MYEKIALQDMTRHTQAVPLWKDSGVAANWLSLPAPKKEAELSGKKARTDDLFGNRGIYVGAEFFTAAMPGGEPFVWHQRLVSYSTTLHGLKRQLDDRYRHLLVTAEVFDMTPDDVRHGAKFGIYYVELPSSVFDPSGPTGGGYTWFQGSSYAQMKHVVQWVTRALQAEEIRQQGAQSPCELTVQYEWSEASRTAIQKITEEVGTVVDSAWYRPQEDEPLDLDEEAVVASLPCPMCHI